ncbi:hypothetical protein R1flu_028078 [Riccia fluitans]|uniref:Uncharacterized protein n=1 Tax=Riccia fluitans TaxID=41844 RepID=A0ABD1XL47_9MARC
MLLVDWIREAFLGRSGVSLNCNVALSTGKLDLYSRAKGRGKNRVRKSEPGAWTSVDCEQIGVISCCCVFALDRVVNQ